MTFPYVILPALRSKGEGGSEGSRVVSFVTHSAEPVLSAVEGLRAPQDDTAGRVEEPNIRSFYLGDLRFLQQF